jgi:peroxiredoxin
MKRTVSILAVAVLWLLPSACGVDTAKNRVGSKIEPVVNAIPAAGEPLGPYCTAYSPDPSLHNHTIPELAGKTPFILVFGTPSHCTQCQNQLDTVKSYRDKYNHAFEVIHIDQYKNSEVYTKLRVKGDPWTFLIGADGVVKAIFPGVTTWDNLDGAIRDMLKATPATDVPASEPDAPVQSAAVADAGASA